MPRDISVLRLELTAHGVPFDLIAELEAAVEAPLERRIAVLEADARAMRPCPECGGTVGRHSRDCPQVD